MCSFVQSIQSQTTLVLQGPPINHNDIDGIVVDTYNQDISTCGSIQFSIDYSFNLPWEGAGNMDMASECTFGPPCAGDPAMPALGTCDGCWDFMYMEFFIDGVKVDENLIGEDGTTDAEQSGTYTSPTLCTNGATNATVRITNQNGAMDETNTFSNVELLCWESDLDAGPDVAICTGQSTALTATSSEPYTWIGGPSNGDYVVTPTTTTTYTATSLANGCPVEDQVDVIVNPKSNISFAISVSPSTVICNGQSVSLTAETAGPYHWNTGAVTQSITVSPTNNTNYTVMVSQDCAEGSANQLIVALPEPVANAGPDLTICRGQNATLQATGGSSYTWNTGQSGSSIIVTPDVTTTYTVTAFTGANCTDIDQVTVFVNDPPNVVADDVQPICRNELVTLTATGASFYTWSNGMNGSSITFVPKSSGNYTVTGTTNGCTNTDNVVVTVKERPIVSAGSDQSICEGGTAILIANGADTYIWSNSDNGATIEISPNTTETLTVTGIRDGCSATDQITINVQPRITASAGDNQEICNGQDAMLSASGGVTYEWSEGAGTGASVTVRPTTTTTYSVTATDRACTDIDQVEVIVTEPFILQSTPDTTICKEDIIQLVLNAPSGTSYNWLSGETTNEINVQPTESKSYSVTATNGVCEVIREIIVEIDDINVTLTPDQMVICFEDEVEVNVSSNGSILWPDGSDQLQRIFTPTKDTSYAVAAISNRGCKAVDSFMLTVNPLPDLRIAGQDYFCRGSATEIRATSGLSLYEWSDGSTAAFRSINTPGTYTLYGTDANGCQSETSVTIAQNELPEPMILGSRTYCPGSSTVLSVSELYSEQIWEFNGSNSTDPTFSIAQNGSVNLVVTDGFGCVGSEEVIITENPDLSPVISGDHLLCENTTGKLDAGDEFDNYEWSTGELTRIIDISTADTYSVTVSTDAGCAGMATVDIPVVSNPTVEIQGIGGFCTEEATLLYIPEFAEMSWSDGTINDSIYIDQPGMISVVVIDENGCQGTDQVDIEEWSLPDVSLTGDLSFCEGDSTLLTLDGADMENITNVEWDDGTLANSIYAMETAERLVLVKDINGCENISSISVVQNANPNPQIIAPSIICEGTETKIFTKESYSSYIWNDTDQTDTLLISNGGEFEIKVTDGNGCIGTDIAMIVASEAPQMEFITGLTFCNTQTGSRKEPMSINLDTAFTRRNITGTWSTSAMNLDLSNLPLIDFEGASPGTYEFTYTSIDAIAPCPDIRQSFSVEVLDCNCPNVVLESRAPLCSVSDQLDLSLVQSTDFEGSWQIVEGPTSVLPSISGDIFDATDQMPGDYILEFRLIDGIAPLGCAESKSVKIEVSPHIDASIQLVNPACGDLPATLMLNLSGGDQLYDVEIMQDNGQVINLDGVPDGYMFDVPLFGVTSFSFSNIESDNQVCGFKSSTDSYVFQPSQLDVSMNLALNYGDYGVSCIDAADGSATITIQSGTAPYSYIWSNGSTDPMITGLSSGAYAVTVEDAVGCQFLDSIAIAAPPAKQIEIDTEDPRCGIGPGQLFIKTVDGIAEGQWEFYIDGTLRSEKQVPATFVDISPGSHIFEAVNSQGCPESHSFVIMADSAYTLNVDDVSVTLGQSVTLQADIGFAYETIIWSPTNYLSDSSAQTVVVNEPLNTTTYTITVIDADGCSVEEMVSVQVNKDRFLGLPTGFTPNADSNNDAFIVHTKSDVIIINNISVFDRWGEEVFTAENVPPNKPIEWDWTFKNEPLIDGLYIWKANATFIDNEAVEFSGQFYIIR